MRSLVCRLLARWWGLPTGGPLLPSAPGRAGRLPAGALLLVLTISIILAATLLAMLLLASNRRLLLQRDARQQQVIRNLYSGLAYAQAHPELPAFRARVLDLFGEGNDSVQVVRQPWGLFDVAVITAAQGPARDTLAALLGSYPGATSRPALYLADAQLALAVGDDAQVRGEAWLPKAGDIRAASLPRLGAPRLGAPVTGRVRASPPGLPPLHPAMLARLQGYAQLQLDDLLPPGSQLAETATQEVKSFRGRPAIWYHREAFTVTQRAKGQVVIISSQRLVVAAASQLDGALLLAPTIVVEPGFRGRVQLIARDTVSIGAHCHLAYPSVACAYGAGPAAWVSLGPGSWVQGVVAASSAEPGLGCVVHLSPGTGVEGQVYSAGIVENCATVWGTTMCRQLRYRNIGSFYENYLINSTLDRERLPAQFVSTSLLNAGSACGIAQWLP
jgi:type II secretory pathway pseudopilin PulG